MLPRGKKMAFAKCTIFVCQIVKYSKNIYKLNVATNQKFIHSKKPILYFKKKNTRFLENKNQKS
jgi:hypothetical protein